MVPTTLYHIAKRADFSQAGDGADYRCATLETERFIHCCNAQQLAGVVERYYQGASDLVLLTIDSARLKCDLVWENTVGGSELFPHVYGTIPLQAVTAWEALDPASVPRMAEDGGA